MKLILRCILAVLTVIWVMNTDRVKAAENSPEQIDFAEHYINSGGTGEIVTVDFDWDGDKDVVRQVLDSPDGNFGFFWDENDGDQQFVTHELQIGDGNVSNISYNSFSVADIDGDGDYDLAAVGNKGGPTALLSWYENDGSNLNFFIHDIERTNALDTYFFWTIATVDFDKDGDMDVITSTYDSWFSGLEDRVILFSNDGAQSFTRLVVASGGWAAFNFAVEDFDNDNDNDLSVGIVSLSGEPNGFYWYGNEGSFPFTSHYLGEPAYSVIASKLNSDSFVDIVVEDTTG